MRHWLLKPRIWFGARPSPPPSPIVLTPADDGPDPDNASRAAAAKPIPYRPQDAPNAGRHERLRPAPTPLPVADGCPGCAGRDRVIREMTAERAELRGRLAKHELAGMRSRRLEPSEHLP